VQQGKPGAFDWKRWATVAAAFLVVFPLLAWAVTYWVVHNRDPIHAGVGTVAVPFAVAALVGLLLAMRAVWSQFRRVVLDEGGIRIRGIGNHRYLPFSKIRDVQVREDAMGAAVVDVTTTAGHTETFTLPANARLTLDQLLQRVAAHAPEPALAARLARSQRTLADWHAALDPLVSSVVEGGYRSAAMDPAALHAMVRDATVEADVRAGAAYVLAAAGTEEDVGVVRAVLGGDAPPIVVVMSALGSRDAGLVEPALLESALEYLDRSDREGAEARLRGGGRPRLRVDARIADGPPLGEAALLDQAEREAEVEEARGKMRRAR